MTLFLMVTNEQQSEKLNEKCIFLFEHALMNIVLLRNINVCKHGKLLQYGYRGKLFNCNVLHIVTILKEV